MFCAPCAKEKKYTGNVESTCMMHPVCTNLVDNKERNE
jgi:hypothetical protein